jgi:hypothetical protein
MRSVPPTPIPATPPGDVSSLKDQAGWLVKKIDESIDYISKMRIRFQRRAGSIRIVTLITSGIVTTLLGIRWAEYSDIFRNVAFVTGTLTTTLAALDLYFNFRGLWIEHEEAEWRLHRLKERIEFYMEGRTEEKLDAVTIAKFHDSYQWIWDNLSTSWLALRRSTRST